MGARRLISLDFLLVYGFGLTIVAATIVTTVERGAGGTIKTFPGTLWWAMSTVTTVGYGDVTPVTPLGRAAAFVLMVGGITFFSAITANVAAFLVKTDSAGEKIQGKRADGNAGAAHARDRRAPARGREPKAITDNTGDLFL